jgi:hypothetical protein
MRSFHNKLGTRSFQNMLARKLERQVFSAGQLNTQPEAFIAGGVDDTNSRFYAGAYTVVPNFEAQDLQRMDHLFIEL